MLVDLLQSIPISLMALCGDVFAVSSPCAAFSTSCGNTARFGMPSEGFLKVSSKESPMRTSRQCVSTTGASHTEVKNRHRYVVPHFPVGDGSQGVTFVDDERGRFFGAPCLCSRELCMRAIPTRQQQSEQKHATMCRAALLNYRLPTDHCLTAQ